MEERILSPGVGRKEIYQRERWRQNSTPPWVSAERSSCWILETRPRVRMTLTEPHRSLAAIVSFQFFSWLDQIFTKKFAFKKSLKINYENLSVTDFKVDAVNWPGTSEESFATEVDTCPTRTSGITYFRDLLIFIFNYFQSWCSRDVRNTTILEDEQRIRI